MFITAIKINANLSDWTLTTSLSVIWTFTNVECFYKYKFIFRKRELKLCRAQDVPHI